MQTIRDIITRRSGSAISAYITAGYPTPASTANMIIMLAERGVDFIELGIPYSDPLADGPVIQYSNRIALENGQSVDLVFSQVKEARKLTDVPIALMGYFNPFLQYGPERFLKKAADAGVQGIIIPDLPMDYYDQHYRALFEKYLLEISFLVTPDTNEERIRYAAALSSGFLYIVSGNAITGNTSAFSTEQETYFRRIRDMKLDVPMVLGFGISDKISKNVALSFFDGVIIGSALLRLFDGYQSLNDVVDRFADRFIE